MPASAQDAALVIATADGSRTLYSQRYAQAYRSRRGALSEARGVFVQGSGAAARLARAEATSVLEIGFGTGLNFLVTALAAAGEERAPLAYLAIERDLPPSRALAELDYAGLLAPSTLPDELLDWCRAVEAAGSPGGLHEFAPSALPNVHLSLYLGEASDLDLTVHGHFDAVYLDAFSPAVNPEPWQADYLSLLVGRLAPGGRLVSFSVSGPVRRALAGLGLAVTKVPGPPGGKREVLVAERSVLRPSGTATPR